MKVRVNVYDSCKYNEGSKLCATVNYEIDFYDVITISPEEIYNMGFDDVDPHNEYLILSINGEESTFRNSYVDMFRV